MNVTRALDSFVTACHQYDEARRLRDRSIEVTQSLVRAAEQAEKAKLEAEYELLRIVCHVGRSQCCTPVDQCGPQARETNQCNAQAPARETPTAR